MKKAVLSNRIYLTVDDKLADRLREELTYFIPSYVNPDKPVKIQNYSIIRKGLWSLPIGRIDLIPEDYEVKDKRLLVPEEFPEFKFPLRESQQLIYDELNDNSIINAKPSWGKTFAGLAIAGKLAQKTLVIVHTVPLRNQWAREVEKVFGIEPSIIGSSKFSTKGPITIGNVQSLYNVIPQIQKQYGTVILDEMHHVSSNTFSKVVDTSFARFKIGLSGTLKRKDGKDVVFTDYFGHKIFRPPPENAMTPEVDVYSPGISLPEVSGQGAWAARINMLMAAPEYQNLVLALAARYCADGHKILCVADRVEFLKLCASRRPNAVAVVGGGTDDDREKMLDSIFGETNEIYGTTSIFKEGISRDILSCLILAAPTNNEPMLEQLIGRIQRPYKGKQTPRIVDIKLDGWTGHKQFQTRLGLYMKLGLKINYL